MKTSTDIFIMGIMLGWGPCLSFCAPILVPYIAAAHSGWFKGFKAALVFSLARIIPYIILAFIATALGRIVIDNFYETKAGLGISLAMGLFIIIIGLVLVLGKSPHLRVCQILSRHVRGNSLKGLIILGFLIGFSPCLPLLGVLAYIAFVTKSVSEGMFLGFCFGLGTLFSPIILFGFLAGGLPKFLSKKPIIYDIFSRLCGAFLIYLGAQLAIKALRVI